MSTNAFLRLKALLPSAPVLVVTVVEHQIDDTSTVELLSGLQPAQFGGISTGATLRVRGTSVAIGSRAFVRDGVIESRAPDGDLVEATVGTVAAQPYGPARLAASASAIPSLVVPVGVNFSLNLAGYWTGGYPPRTYAVEAGTLPSGLAFRSATGELAGTVASAAAVRAITLRCTDCTGRSISLAPFNLSAS